MIPADEVRALLERVPAAAAARLAGDVDEATAAARWWVAEGPGRLDRGLALAARAAGRACAGAAGMRDRAPALHAGAVAAWTALGDRREADVERRTLRRIGGPVPLGPFQLREELGRGGMGRVFAARHAATGEDVAVKLLGRSASVVASAALQGEIRALAGLDHPGIVPVLATGLVDAAAAAIDPSLAEGTPWLAVERARGGTLAPRCGRTPWPACRRVLVGILDALAHAHARGLVHLDVKPENVLLDGPDDRPTPRLADFGLARRPEDEREVRAAGTPAYMAPEQYLGRARDVGPATDLYAVGCLAVQLVCGAPPFASATTFEALRDAHLAAPPPPLRPRVPAPAGLAGWIARLLEKAPRDRFPSAAAAARALLALGDAEGGPGDTDAAGVDPADLPTVVLPAWSAADLPRRRATSGAPAPVPPVEVPARWAPPDAPRPRLPDAGLGLLAMRRPRPVGRGMERDRLWALLRDVVEERRPRTALITGPPGIGVRHLGRWLAERAAEVGAARAIGVDLADGSLADLAVAWFRCAGLDRAALEARVRAVLADEGVADEAELHAWVDALAPGAGPRPALRRLVARLVLRAGAERPLIVRVDAADRGDDALHLAAELAERPARVLLVLTSNTWTRPPRELAATHLPLGPLGPAEVRALVGSLLRASEALATHLAGASAGNPGDAVRALQVLAAGQQLALGRDGFALRAGVDLGRALSGAGEPQIAARIERLPDDVRRVLGLAALLAPRIDPRVLEVAARAAGVDPPGPAVAALVDAGLLLPGPDRLGFADGATLRAATPPAERRPALHAACAAALASHESAAGPHLLRAGRPAEAIDPLRVGVEAALVERRLEDAATGLADLDAALAAAAAPEDDPRRGATEVLRGQLALERRRLPELEAIVREALARAERFGWRRVLAEATQLEAERLRLAGDARVSDALLVRARDAWLALGDPHRAARCLHRLAGSALLAGDTARAEEIVREAIALVGDDEQLRIPRLAFQVTLARVVLAAGRPAEAGAIARAVLPEVPLRPLRANTENLLGEIARATGDLDGAAEHYARAAALDDALGSLSHAPRLNLALVRVLQGRAEEADAVLERLLPAVRRDDPSLVPGVLAVRLAALADAPEGVVAPVLAAFRATPVGLRQREVLETLELAAGRARSRGHAARAAVLLAEVERLRKRHG